MGEDLDYSMRPRRGVNEVIPESNPQLEKLFELIFLGSYLDNICPSDVLVH